MKMNVYCMQDSKVGFMQPTVDVNDQSAARNFSSAILQSQGVLFTHAEDFRLYRIGEFDQETGAIAPISPIVLIADGSCVLRGGDRHVPD